MSTPQEHFQTLFTHLTLIQDDATRAAYTGFHMDHQELFLSMPASVKQHHSWPGGYAVHISEVVTNLMIMVKAMPLPPLTFTNDDAICSAYVHDLDKLLYRYELDPEKPTPPQAKYAASLGIEEDLLETKSTISAKIDAAKNGTILDMSMVPRHTYRKDAMTFDDGAIVMKLCADHGLKLSEIALHAVCVHHGGFSALANDRGSRMQMKDLGVLIHAADLMSASVQRGEVLTTHNL